MAETSGFFNAEMVEGDGSTTYDRIYYADQFAYYFSKFISNGVYINPATQLKVTSKGELKLNVAVGDAFINGYWYKNDENFELQLAQANGSLPRIDRVVLRWDSLTRYINLAILQGNPAATPSAKNLTRNADTWELGLADVYIERGVLSISDSNITDLRPDRTYCGYVAGVVNQIDTTNLFAQFTDAFEQYYEKQVMASDKFSSDLAKKYNDYAVLAETNFGKWMTDTKGDFDTWYETIQAMLSDEEAVKLANQISELKKQFQLLALRGLKTDLFELASNDGSVFTENAQNAYVFLKQIYGKSELVNDAFISVGESGALEFDSVDATNENVSSAKLTTGMPLRGFIIDDVAVANYTDANGKYWLCDSIELSVDGYWYCIKRVGSILSYNSESVGSIYKTPTGTLDKGKQVLYKLSDYVVSKLTDEEQSQLSELLSYGGGKLPVTTGSNAAEAIQLHVEQNVTDENGVHNIRFRNGSLQYKEGSEWKDAKQYSMNVDFSTSTSKSLNDSIEAHLVLSNATRNLLPYPYAKASGSISYGVTMTYTNEGTISLDGTITGNNIQPGFALYENVEKLFNGAINTLYSKYDTTIKGSLHSFFQIFKKNDGSWVTNVETLSKNDYDWANYKCNYVIQYHKTSGDIHGTVSNIRIVTNADDPFVPYSGYDIKTCGKNLLNPTLATTTADGVTCTNNGNGTYTLSGTATKHAYRNIAKTTLPMGKCKIVGAPSLYKNHFYITKANDFSWIRYSDEEFEVTDSSQVYVIVIRTYSGSSYTKILFKPMLTTDLNATYDDYEPYVESSVHIDSSTEFPVTGLKSFDGVTNIISPGNVKVTYAKSESGAAILDASKNKLDKDDIVNNQTTTVKGFALDARQANPNIKGSLGAQIKAINDRKMPNTHIADIMTMNGGMIFDVGSSNILTPETVWDPDNGGYRVSVSKTTNGGLLSMNVCANVPANSVVYILVSTLNRESISIQGAANLMVNTTNAVRKDTLYTKIQLPSGYTSTTINFMPVVFQNV
jgi:hypothetical protein